MSAIIPLLQGVKQTRTGWIARCPAHEDRSPSLSVRIADDGRTLVRCFAGCSAESVVEAVGLSLSDLFPPRVETRNISSMEGVSRPRETVPRPERTYRPWEDLASHLWHKAQPIKGTLAERYLLSRNCMLPPADGDLRFLPASGEHPAAMVARITDAVTCEPISLHFTQLAPDGSKIGRRLLSGHRKAGGCVRLWADDAVTYSLGIGEGIETALSLAHGHAPVWAAIDAGNLASFRVLDGIETLIVAADHDNAGMAAAAELGRRWADAGKVVKIVMPDTSGQDLNDAVAA